jgi:hypothetical protein
MIIKEYVVQIFSKNNWIDLQDIYQDQEEALLQFYTYMDQCPKGQFRVLYRETSIFEEEIA